MAVDMTVLRERLEEYAEQLEHQRITLQHDFDDLTKQWLALSQVYEGQAAEQFRVAWRKQMEAFDAYLNAAGRISPILRERIEALWDADRLSKV